MVNNSDYLPMIHSGMIEFNEKMKSNIDRFNENLDSLIAEQKRRFTFKHEPQIELPFDAEYKNIVDKINKDYGEKYHHRERLTHAFLSGYLPSGASIRFRPENYQAIFINGTEIDSGVDEYVCRAEEGGAEKLNVLVFMPFKGQGIEYADIPLCEFKMLLHDDEKSPDIRSFIESGEIDTLKYVGDMTWTSSEVCTLRRLEITGDIYVTGNMRCICLRDLIIPNVTNVPNTNVDCTLKPSLKNVDISNVSGNVANLCNARFGDLRLNCSKIDGLAESYIDTLDTGNKCIEICAGALKSAMIRKVIIGANCSLLRGTDTFASSKIVEVEMKNVVPIKIDNRAFLSCRQLKSVSFTQISEMHTLAFSECGSLANLSFIPHSVSTSLYFSYSPLLTEQSCLNIINALDPDSAVRVSLHTTVKFNMQSVWYCKPDGDNYISCTADDEGAITQAEALLARGGTIA